MLPVLRARIHGAGAGVGSRPVSVTSTGMGEAVGGYHSWIVRSMLRRAEMRMTWIVKENGGVPPVPAPISGVVPFLRVPEWYEHECEYGRGRSPFYEDEDGEEDGDEDGRSLETDTDGSSIHTPTSPSLPVSSPPTQTPSPHLKPYKALQTQTHRLRYLLARLTLLSRRLDEEEKAGMDMPEVKSRRRAWGNGGYLPLGGGGWQLNSGEGAGAGGRNKGGRGRHGGYGDGRQSRIWFIRILHPRP